MLRRLIFTTAVLGVVAFTTPAAAQRHPAGGSGGRGDHGGDNGNHPGHTRPHSIPEFDPATAGAIAAVLAGGGVLIARRRRR